MEFLENGKQRWIAGPHLTIVAGDAEAVRLQRLQSVFDLSYASLDVAKGHDGQQAEAFGIVAHDFCANLIDLPRQGARLLIRVKEPAVSRMRKQGCGNAILVHLFEGSSGRPALVRPTRELRCLEMMMDVDAARIVTAGLTRGLRQQSAPRKKPRAGGCQSLQEFATGSIYQSHCYSLLGFRTISKTVLQCEAVHCSGGPRRASAIARFSVDSAKNRRSSVSAARYRPFRSRTAAPGMRELPGIVYPFSIIK